MNDLLHLHEFDIVAEHDVQMIGSQPAQAYIDALCDAPGGKIKVREVAAAQPGAERVDFAGTPLRATPSSTSLMPRP